MIFPSSCLPRQLGQRASSSSTDANGACHASLAAVHGRHQCLCCCLTSCQPRALPDHPLPVQSYPHIFVSSGLHDPRVAYWEPAKWVAKLRTHKQDNNMLLHKVNLATGVPAVLRVECRSTCHLSRRGQRSLVYE